MTRFNQIHFVPEHPCDDRHGRRETVGTIGRSPTGLGDQLALDHALRASAKSPRGRMAIAARGRDVP